VPVRRSLDKIRALEKRDACSQALAVDFYLYAAVVGTAISALWIAWLLAARAVLRTYQLKPGYLLSILQVAIVLGLLFGGFRASDYLLGALGRTLPADVVLFRRVWIVIWAIAMIASIQIFLEIRGMATPASPPASYHPSTRPKQQRGRTRRTRR
jgi:hypothetical protein